MPIRKFLARKVRDIIHDEVLPYVLPPHLQPPGEPSVPGPFQYTPLASPREEIRLLEVLPSRPGDLHNVYCNIKHVRLDANFPYAAVSYTWGPSTEPTSIIIGGKELKVPHSAYEALRGLRNPTDAQHGEGSKVVWVDAVCIDQQNMPEKEQQILAMKEVYQRAQHVYVWLHANPGDDPLRAINFLVFDPKAKNQAIRLEVADIEAFNAFLNHTWFSRTWTFQEVVLPRSISIVYGSSNGNPRNNEVLWDKLVVKADALVNPTTDVHFYTPGPDVLKVLISILEIDKTRKRLDGFSYTLEYALFSTRGRSVTDARDSVYALLGIAKDAMDLNIVPSYKLSVAQAYQDSAVRILQRTDSLRLLSAGSLEHRNTGKTPDLPSWVPDWSSTSNLKLLGHRAEYPSLDIIRTSTLPWISTPSFPHPEMIVLKGYIIDAPKSVISPFPTTPKPLASSDGFQLNIGGGASLLSKPTTNASGEEFTYAWQMLTTLDLAENLVAAEFDPKGCHKTFPPWPQMSDSDSRWAKLMALMQGDPQFYSESSTYHEQNCPKLPFEQFCRVITASPLPNSAQSNEPDGPKINILASRQASSLQVKYMEYKLSISRFLGLHPETKIHKPDVARILPSEADIALHLQDRGTLLEPVSKPSDLPFHGPLTYATEGRRFCLTLLGKMALVPVDTQPGKDLILLLEGAATPMLVRKAEDADGRLAAILGDGKSPLHLVGECWVDGATTGAEIEELIRGKEVVEYPFV